MTSSLRAALTILPLLASIAPAMSDTAFPLPIKLPVATAVRLAAPPSLDDEAWNNVPAQRLAMLKDTGGATPLEAGKIRFAHDGTTLYVRFELEDTDIVQESNENQRHHYETGDVVELFLKPEGATWYWEFYATPNGRKTAFFYPGRGYKGLPSTLNYRSDIQVAAQIDGTLNNWRDRDTGWTATMSIPLAELSAAGIPLNPATPWRVLVGRYNFGRYLPEPELSMYPSLTKLDFHRHEEWARLQLLNAPAAHNP